MAKKDPKTSAKSSANELIAENQSTELVLPWSKINPVLLKVIKSNSKHLKIAGFRKGKVPPSIAKQHLDQQQVIGRVLEQLSPEYFSEYLKGLKTSPTIVGQPEVSPVSTQENQDWQVKITWAEKPTFSVMGYKKIVSTAKKTAKKEWDKQLKEAKQPPQNPQQAEQDFTQRQVLTQLISELKPPVPELLVRKSTQQRLEYLARTLKQLKMEVGTYLTQRQMTEQQLVAQTQAEVIGEWQTELVLDSLATELKIEVNEEELKQALTDIKDPRSAQFLSTPAGQDHLRRSLVKRKTVDQLLSL